jgi:hypothetical protein
MVDTKDRVDFPTDEQMANLRAPAGKFRVIAVDTFEGPFAHAVVGDFTDKAEAFSEAHRIETKESNGGFVKCHVYDDKGQHLTPPLSERHDHNSTVVLTFFDPEIRSRLTVCVWTALRPMAKGHWNTVHGSPDGCLRFGS